MYHRYAPITESCSRVRQDVRSCLADWGVDDETAETAVVVANELAANAVDHAHTGFTLGVVLGAGDLRVEVTDASAAEPRLRPHDTTSVRGRGLQMVDALSADWAVTYHDSGKTVAATILFDTDVVYP